MSYTKDVVVYPELRPPVASIDGKSPLRGKRLTNIFKAHARMSKDRVSSEVTSRLIVNKYTDDGMLAPNDDQWNNQHQTMPSKWNNKFHTHYKQFFDKNHRQT